MAKSRYKSDPKGLRDIGNTRAMGNAVEQVANKGLKWAQASAPVDSGKFKGNFSVEQQAVKAGKKGETRQGAIIKNTTPYAHFVHRAGEKNFMNQIVARVEGTK